MELSHIGLSIENERALGSPMSDYEELYKRSTVQPANHTIYIVIMLYRRLAIIYLKLVILIARRNMKDATPAIAQPASRPNTSIRRVSCCWFLKVK